VRPKAAKKMNYWDYLPNDLQTYILQLRAELDLRAVVTLQKNWRRHPAIRSNLLATSLLARTYMVMPSARAYVPSMRMSVMSPDTASALEYCAKHSGMGYPKFWTEFCITVLDELIMDQYSGGPGAQYYNRCETAHENIMLKYDTGMRWDVVRCRWSSR
jgi:hypothetical protein